MKNAKHTPGPWRVEKPFDEPGWYVSGPNTGLVCKLYPPDATLLNGDSRVSIQSNAQLIASAPDLLEALEACLESGILTPLTPNTVRQARAAITKARGNG